MADLDIPGLGHARMALTALAKKPKQTSGMKALKMAIIRELYPEIRAARLAGHSWMSINNALKGSGMEPKVSTHYIGKAFRRIDKEQEKLTGVKALPVDAQHGGKKKKKSPGDCGAPDPKSNNVSQEIIS